jgi:hypothetical protein
VLTFVDAQGVEWEVREISDPSFLVIPSHHLRHPEFVAGWLLFSSASERRRLAPYPAGWQELSQQDLDACCRQARPVSQPERWPSVEQEQHPEFLSD